MVEANPVVEWIRAHFARQGRPIIPQEAYRTRERGELVKDASETRSRIGPIQEELLGLFASRVRYREFASGRDFSFGLADVPDADFLRVLESVLKALRELVASGAVKAAREVILPSVPMVFLRRVTLFEGEWVDRHVIEMAEFGTILADCGFTLVEDGDQHPLACPSIRASEASVVDAVTIRKQAIQRMSDFSGRSILVDGRPYLNVADYQSWSGRKLKAELKFDEGFSIESFNQLGRRARLG